MKIIEVKIERIGLGTGGIGYHLGKVVFIPFTMPGDIVRAAILENKKKYIRAEVIEILQPSLDRVLAPCMHFSICGGCHWQHIPYQKQLEYKTKIVYDRLKLSAQKHNIDIESVEWNPIEASPQEFRYRHRIRVHKQQSKVGFYQQKSHHLVAVSDCHLVPMEINQKFLELSQDSKYADGNYELSLADQQVSIVNIDKEPTAFTQVNELVNNKIHQIIEQQFSLLLPTNYLDLYCGAGNFTFLMHKMWGRHQAQGLGVELNVQSIEQARNKQLQIGISPEQLTFLVLDTKELIRRPLGSTDFILVDPPRAGLEPELIDWMNPLLAGCHVIYMSCDPMTLDRDLIHFYKNGFRLNKVWLFDMFAQTDHVESLVLLTKR
jgi:23S rRNA (uracil1939-C5)-methyltransferase